MSESVSTPSSPAAPRPAFKESGSKWKALNLRKVKDAAPAESVGRRSSLELQPGLPQLAQTDGFSKWKGVNLHQLKNVSEGVIGHRASVDLQPAVMEEVRRTSVVPMPAVPVADPPSVMRLANALVEHFGSLSRGYEHFDFDKKGRFTRAQFYAGCASVRINFKTLSGMTVREIFKRIDEAEVEGGQAGQVTLRKWNKYFAQELEGTEEAELLTADHGSQVEKRLEERRKERNLKKVGEEVAANEPPPEVNTLEDATQIFRAKNMFLKKLHSRTQELGLPEKEDEDPTSSTGSLGRFRGLAATLRRTQSGLRSNSGLSGGTDPPTPKGGWWPMTEAEAAEQQEQVVPGSAGPLSTSGLLSSNSSRPGTGFTEGKERPSGLQSPTSLLSGQSGRSTGRQDHSEATQATQGSPSSRGNSNPRSRVQHASTAPAGPDLEESESDTSSSTSSSEVAELDEQMRPKRSFAEWQAAILGDDDDEAADAPDLSRSGPPSEHVARVLKHGMDGRDLQELSDNELQAVAEQEQLAAELAAMNASGRLALAYVFVKKMGSLKRAFRWFDTRRIGKIAQVVWDTGFTLLHIDSEKLTGWKPFEIFRQIDVEPCDGMISMKEWKSYFKEAAETIAAEMEEKGTSDFSQQSKLRGHAMKHKAAKSRRSQRSAYDKDPWLLDLKEKQAIAKQEEDFRRRVTDKLMTLQENESFNFGREWLCHVDDKVSPVRRSIIVEEVAEKLRLFWLPSPALVDLRNLHRSINVSSGIFEEETNEPDYSLLEYLSISQEEAAGPVPPTGTDAGSMMVMNLTEYAQEVEEKLESIPLHGSMTFPSSLSETHRAVVQLLSKRLGYVAVLEPIGANMELVVYNVASDFVNNIEIQLNGLRQNEGTFFTEDLSEEERQLARVLSENLGFLTTRNDDGTLSAFNLQDFANEIRQNLSSLEIGEEIRMPVGMKSEEQQVMIYRLIKELGLEVREEGVKKQREAIIGNMVNYLSDAKDRMMKAEDGEVLNFILPPQEPQIQAFFNLAKEFAFECTEQVNTDDGVEAHMLRMALEKISVAQRRRRSSVVKSQSELQEQEVDRKPRGQEVEEVEIESNESSEGLETSSQATSLSYEEMPEPIQRSTGEGLIGRVFQQYSSGRWLGGSALFFRYSDLKALAEDLKYITPNVDTKLFRFTGMFEYIFEDTLQLQIDMGVPIRHGLTLEWFHIFLQKVILRLGIQFVPVLFTLLDPSP